MKTTKSSPRQALTLAISVLVLASLACQAIATPTPEPTQATALTGATSEEAPEMPEDTPLAPPAKVTDAPPPPPASWQPIPDLPRHINALVVDPAAPQVLYAGTGSTGAGSGVYKSEDAGLTWHLASAGLPSEDVVALAFSEGDPPILYAAVGNSIFASTDGAASWSQQAQGVGNYRGFERLRVAPGDGRVLFGVAVIEGTFRSDDGGHNWIPVNEGLPEDDDMFNVQSLAVDPTDANVVYLGTGWGPFHGNGVYKSTDGGATWAPANRGMIDYSITALAVDPAEPQIVYAGGDGGELFKSSDGGETWSDLTDKLPGEEHSRSSIQDIAIDQAAPETVYLLCERAGVLVSYDGGARWQLLGKPGEPEHPSLTAMTVIFDSEPVLIVGIRGEGGWRYGAGQPAPAAIEIAPPPADVTAAPTPPPGSWQSVPDLPRQVNALVVDPTNPQVLYAGTGSTGAGSGVYKSEDAGLTWHLASAGLPSEDVVALAFSEGDPPILYAAVGNSIFASTDGAASWSQQAQGVGNYRGFERLRVAPGDGRVLFGVAVIEGTFRSDDGGHNWIPVNEGLPEDDDMFNVQSLAVDPTDANVVYLGTGWRPFHGNGVYKSTDGGATWAAANRGMLDYSITALAVDPANPQTVYAGTFDGELFKSADGGETWSDLTDNLPGDEYSRSSIQDIAIDPAAPETVYLLCERAGVLVSYDGGARWQLLGKPGEPEYPSLTALVIIFGPRPVLVIGIGDEGGWRYAAD